MADSGWRKTTVGALCDEGVLHTQTGPFGSQLHSYDYVPSGIPVVPTEGIGRRRLLTAGIPEVAEETAARLSRHRLQSGDILFARRGVQATGLSAIVTLKQAGWLCGTGAILLRATGTAIDPVFLSFFLSSDESIQWLKQHAVGAVMPNLNEGVIRKLPLTLPPLPAQKAIAAVLGALDDKIEVNRRMNATLEAMARALFRSWFVDFDPVRSKLDGRKSNGLESATAALFPTTLQESPFGPIPRGWAVKPLAQICTLGRGASPRPINDFMNGEVPWVKIADATAAGGPFLFETKERLKTAGVDKSVSVAPGDLILSNSATCGVPMFVELHGCIHDGWLYFKNLREISKLYLFHVLIELAEHLVHIADGSVQKNLNTNLVGQQNVLVPPKAIVDAFDAQATVWFARVRQNGLESRTLATLRDTLLPKLLSGEVRL